MDLAMITDWAKDTMLTLGGHHGPMLFVETDKRDAQNGKPTLHIVALANGLPEWPELRRAMFIQVGQRFAADFPDEHLEKIAFIFMAWATMTPVSQPVAKVRPSQDPNRIELLVISYAAVTPGGIEQDGAMVEIIRDRKGKVLDLFQRPEVVERAQDFLLMGFIEGVRNPTMSVPEIMRYLDDLKL